MMRFIGSTGAPSASPRRRTLGWKTLGASLLYGALVGAALLHEGAGYAACGQPGACNFCVEKYPPLPKVVGFNRVWGARRDDVWAVGDEGAMLHWDGKAWAAVDSGTRARLTGIAGNGAGEVWVVGGPSGATTATVLHTQGGLRWTSIGKQEAMGVDLNDVWVSDQDTVWVAGSYRSGDGYVARRRRGADWTPFFLRDGLTVTGIWGTSSLIYTVGYINTLDPARPAVLTALTEDGQRVLDDTSQKRWYYGVRGTEELLWTVGAEGSVQFVPLNLQNIFTENKFTGVSLYGIWTMSKNDIWVVGDGGSIWHRGAGGAWTQCGAEVNDDLRSIWGSGPDDIWAVGSNGAILHHSPASPGPGPGSGGGFACSLARAGAGGLPWGGGPGQAVVWTMALVGGLVLRSHRTARKRRS